MVRFFVFVGLFTFSSPALAQKVVEMFDGQNELPESNGIQISSLDQGDPSAVDSSGGSGFTLHFDRDGSSMLVPATVQGKSVYFLFDTGATTTTLAAWFAKEVNLLPKSDYPVGQFQTANGPASAQFGVIERLVLGGRLHAGVTFSMCASCPAGMFKGKPIVGLLGLNVISRYRVSIDDGAGKIEMSPGTRYSDRSRDIMTWLSVADYRVTVNNAGRHKSSIDVKNLAPRRVAEVTLVAQCSNGKSVEVEQKAIEAHSKATFSKSIAPADCQVVGFDFDQPKW